MRSARIFMGLVMLLVMAVAYGQSPADSNKT